MELLQVTVTDEVARIKSRGSSIILFSLLYFSSISIPLLHPLLFHVLPTIAAIVRDTLIWVR